MTWYTFNGLVPIPTPIIGMERDEKVSEREVIISTTSTLGNSNYRLTS